MIVLVDYSWALYRSKFAFHKLYVIKRGIRYNTGAIFGMYNSISTIFKSHPTAQIYLCLDGHPTKQLSIDQSYKANRDHTQTTDSIDIPYSEMAYQLSIIPQVHIAYSPIMEADETIGFLVETVERREDEKVIIFSTDMDLRQLVDSKRNIYCSKTEVGGDDGSFLIEDEDYVYKIGASSLNGVKPESIALFKAIAGDSGDNVKGIPYFNKQLIKTLSNECVTLEKLKQLIFKTGLNRHRRAYEVLRGEWDRIEKNYGLVKIDPSDVPEIVDTHEKASLEWYEYYESVKVLAGVQRLIQEQTR